MQKNFIQSLKDFKTKVITGFKNLDKRKKYAIGIGAVAIILAIVFTISYSTKNKYGVLFSGLDANDAANISKALEDKKVETKIKGDTIYVPKKDVDKLRLELSPSISNGSKGFELMDEGSNISMTDEEFEIKKLRMLQGELEKTIKTFPQVEDARVHITQGEESVFSKNTKQGMAAVYVSLKAGRNLEESQIKSIISLVSASSRNIPKQNIEVIDQNMTLLSEGIYDENGNVIKGGNGGLATSRDAEKQLGKDLQKSVISMLEPIFGKDKVKASVNASLNFDTVEKNEVKVDPDKVIKSESKSENSSTDKIQTGSPVDNNMTNTAQGNDTNIKSKEEKIEYEVGKTETKTITTSGNVKRITASVAIDGNLIPEQIGNVEKMVYAAIGMANNRGDQLSVVSMRFNGTEDNVFDKEKNAAEALKQRKMTYGIGAVIVLIAIIVGIILYRRRKARNEEEDELEDSNDYLANIIKEKEIDIEKDKYKEPTLEDQVKSIVSKNPDEVTKLIKTWLND